MTCLSGLFYFPDGAELPFRFCPIIYRYNAFAHLARTRFWMPFVLGKSVSSKEGVSE